MENDIIIDELLDITEVCEIYNVSSRTLRFYEEAGLIESCRTANNNRRKYNKEQIAKIRDVLALRALGLSIKTIQEYLQGNVTLTEMVHLRKAEIEASIRARMQEIHILEAALAAIEDGTDFFCEKQEIPVQNQDSLLQIARACAEYIVYGELDKLYLHFSKKIKEYMPVEAFQARWRDTIVGIGEFVEFGKTFKTPDAEHIVYQRIVYQKMIVQLKFVFQGEIIHGFWMQYLEK